MKVLPLILTTTLFLAGLGTKAQNAEAIFDPLTRIVTYDAQCKDGYLHQGKNLVLKIKNPNPLLYQFTVTKSSTVRFNNPNSAISSYVTLDVTTNASTGQKAGGAAPVVQGQGLAPNDLGQKVNQVKPLAKAFVDAEAILLADIASYTRFYNTLVIFQGAINDWKNQLSLPEATVRGGVSDIENSLKGIIQTYYTRHAEAKNPYTDDNGSIDYTLTYQTINDFASKLKDQVASDLQNYDKAYDALNSFETAEKANIPQIVTSLNSQHVDLGIDLSDFPTITSKKQTNDTNGQKLVSDYTATYSTNFSNLAANISLAKNLLFNPVFGPFVIKDEDEILLKISQVNSKTNNDELSSFDGIVIRRQGGLKIDFSAGLFGSGLYDKSYVTSQSTVIETDTTVSGGVVTVGPAQATYSKIIARGGAHFSYGPMAFIHFHTKTGNAWDFGGYFGTGFLFKDNSKPVISLGFNALTGPYQRLVIGLGVAMAQVTRLSSKYQEGQSYKETITDVPTENQYKASWLLSVSWNFSN